MIQTYKIRAQITLYSFVEGGKKIDLTPWVRTVNTDKNVANPSGTFQISLLPVAIGSGELPWYYRITPMDYVEIRFTRDHSKKEIPIVMRGFVDSISRTADLDQNGAPIRGYTINGRDYGKILEISRIYYMKEVFEDIQLIRMPGFEKLKAKFGANIEGKAVDIIGELLKIAQNQVDVIRTDQNFIPQIEYLGSSTIQGYVNQFSMTQEDGSVWELMRFFDNTPWNELYVTDLESGPKLVFRESPWKDFDKSNELIQDMAGDVKKATLGDSIVIEPSSIKSFSVSRTDTEVKNYFFSYPTQVMIKGTTSLKAIALEGIKTEKDLDSNPFFIKRDDTKAGINRYGFRRFENTSEYMARSKNEMDTLEMCKKLNLDLVRAMKNNSLYESGSFTMKGNSNIQLGKYVSFQTGRSVNPEFYVAGVSHALNLQENTEQFSSTLTVQRGDGFLKTREQIDGTEPDYGGR